MLPNFLIIGAMKSGTTSLYHHLRTHPDVFMPRNKEPEFFANDAIWARGAQWYESLFADGRGKKALGEASASYTKYPYFKQVPQRIASLVPSMKCLYLLRSPIERIYSHYLHNIYAGIETEPFARAILDRPLYIQASLYYNQIEQYLQHFPRAHLKVLLLEELQQAPAKTVKEVFTFLSIDPEFTPPNLSEVKHQSKLKRGRDNRLMKLFRKAPFYNFLADTIPDSVKASAAVLLKAKLQDPQPISDALYHQLLDQLSDDLDRLETFLGKDLSHWRRRRDAS
jgi:hypothetical protein